MHTNIRWLGTLVFLTCSVALYFAGCSAEGSGGGGGKFNPYLTDGGVTILPDGRVVEGDGENGSDPPYNNGGRGGGGSDGADAGMDPDILCAGEKVDPVPVEIEIPTEVPYEVIVPQPIAVYILQDKSGSMNDGAGNPPVRKWDTAVESINTFVTDPQSEFMQVALQVFSGDGPCDGSVYDTPAVPMGELPGNASPISSFLAGIQPDGYTPLEGALRGLTTFCNNFQLANPDLRCVGVLISDGRPTRCNQDSNALIDIARNAYDLWDVRTFTVGMQGDTDFDLLNQIAMWGGTDCTPNPDGTANPADGYACDVRPGSGMTLLQAFEAIREFVTELDTRTEIRIEIEIKIAECEWGIPDPPEGETFDKNMVNVIFSQPGEKDLIIPRVEGASADDASLCDDVENGWYYDDPDDPTTLVACGQTCDFITSIENATIEIQFGCETEIIKVE